MRPTARRSTWTTGRSTAISSGCGASSARSILSSSRSKRSMASDTGTATPDRRFGRSLANTLRRLLLILRLKRRAVSRRETSTLLRRRRQSRRHSPLTRRILLLNIVPVALLALGAVYLSDYEDELIDAELASLLVQG